jgi:flagellar hook assembly protein FlgD
VRAAATVVITIYDRAGVKIKTVLDTTASAGESVAFWDGTDDRGEPVPAGTYHVIVKEDGTARRLKILVLK